MLQRERLLRLAQVARGPERLVFRVDECFASLSGNLKATAAFTDSSLDVFGRPLNRLEADPDHLLRVERGQLPLADLSFLVGFRDLDAVALFALAQNEVGRLVEEVHPRG